MWTANRPLRNNSNSSETMPSCSRCGCASPNPSCFVCAEQGEPNEEYDDQDDTDDAYTDRLIDRADFLRDERKDRQIEAMWAEFEASQHHES